MIPLVRTAYGLVPAHRAAEVNKVAEDHEKRRREFTQADAEARAAAIGLKIADVRARLQDGDGVVRRAIANAIRGVPRYILERAYPCSGCKTLRDDAYKADCAAKSVQPCFVAARLKGCVSFTPAATVA